MTTISAKEFLKGGKPTFVQGATLTPQLNQPEQQGWYSKLSEKGANYSANAISEAFKGGVAQGKQGYEKAKNAKNVGELFGGSLNLLGGAIGATFSPLAPLITKPISKVVEYEADKISNIKVVQDFSQTPAGEATAAGAEAVGNLSTIAATVAGVKAGTPKVGEMASNIKTGMGDTMSAVSSKVKPTIAGAGRVLKEGGEGAYGITTTASEGTARAMQTYKESTPNLMSRIKNTVTGETKGKPTTEANTAARFGLIGTEKEIGVQAGRFMEKTWKETVQPALKNTKGRLEMNKFWSVLEKKIRAENPELLRRNALLEGLNDLKSGYTKVSKIGLEKLQEYKEGWTKFQSEQVWKGKPIASATKEVMKMAGDAARDFIYKNTPPEVRQAYIDYGNLKSIREAGIKSGVGDLAKKSISRGA